VRCKHCFLFSALEKFFFLRLVAVCHSFCIFIFLSLFTIHTFIQSLIHNICRGPYPYLHRCRLSAWAELQGVRSRDSNSGLPYTRPAHYHLSCAAPYLSCAAPYLSCAAPYLSCAAPYLSCAAPYLSCAAPYLSCAAPYLSCVAPS
jgi:hypothetical protein